MPVRNLPADARGFTLIELMIVVAIIAVLLAFGAPSLSSMLLNRRIYGAAESVQSALNLARSEALRRNVRVRFSLVSALDSSCIPQTTGPAWVVSRGSPAALCHKDPAALDDAAAPDSTDPKTVRVGTTAGYSDVTLAADSSFVIFDGSGMVALGTGAGERGGLTYTANPTTGLQEMRIVVDTTSTSAERRPMWVTVSPNGRIRMCDTKVVDSADPRHC